MTQTNDFATNREFKSRIFSMIFSDKKELLELYNAISGKDYKDSEQLEINTLDNAIYMAMHNDVSFLIQWNLNLYEQQSTFNPNMPLRYLFYVSDIYSAMVKNKNIYGTKLIEIPAPQFIVFYNGEREMPDEQILRLSDAYILGDEENSLELKVRMLNINQGHNEELLRMCKTLGDYSKYTHRVRKYAKEMDIKQAVELSVKECISEGILKEFLELNQAEAIKMSIYEYDQAKHIQMEREQAKEDARIVMKCEMIRKLLKTMGVDEIVKITEWDEKTVLAVVEAIRNNPEMLDESIAEKVGLL